MSGRMTYNPVTGRYTYRIDPIVDVTGISAVETEISLRKNSTAYSFGARVLYPGIGKAGYVLVYSSALPMRYTASSLPEFPSSVTSGATTLQDGQVTWTIYDLTAPEISMVNGLNTALGNKADKDLGNLTTHTAIDSNCNVDYVIKRWSGTNSWYRLWKSGWVEQGGQCKGTNASGNATTTVSFPIAFADTKYCILKNYNSNSSTSSPFAAHVSFYDKTETSAKTYNWGTVDKDWYACGIGDATEIAALLA